MGLAVVFLVLYVSVMGYAGDRITAWLNPEADAHSNGMVQGFGGYWWP